jgi:hypothetical protein
MTERASKPHVRAESGPDDDGSPQLLAKGSSAGCHRGVAILLLRNPQGVTSRAVHSAPRKESLDELICHPLM